MRGVICLLLCFIVSGSRIRPRTNVDLPKAGDSQLTLSETSVVSVPTTYTKVDLSVSVKQNFGHTSPDEIIQRVMDLASNTTQEVSGYIQGVESVAKFHTTGISLSPISKWDSTSGVSTDIGYQATNSISFQVLNSVAGSVIAGTVRTGSPYVSINSVSFIACDDDLAAGQKTAVKNALLAATNQAEFVLETLGLCHDHIASINLSKGSTSEPIPLGYALKSAAVAEAADLPVSGGNQDVSASVSLTVAFKECVNE